MEKELLRRIEDLEHRLDALEKLLGFTEEQMKREAVTRFLEQRVAQREQWRRRSMGGYE